MKLALALIIGLFALPALATSSVAAPSCVSDGRAASLLGGDELAGSFLPSPAGPLRLTDDIRFALADMPALDHGGGMDRDVRQILALLLGFFPGFGIGHLIAHNRSGFILFLLIDIALAVVWYVA